MKRPLIITTVGLLAIPVMLLVGHRDAIPTEGLISTISGTGCALFSETEASHESGRRSSRKRKITPETHAKNLFEERDAIRKLSKKNISICDSRGINPTAQKELRLSSGQVIGVKKVIDQSIEQYQKIILARMEEHPSAEQGEVTFRVAAFPSEAAEMLNEMKESLSKYVGSALAAEIVKITECDSARFFGGGKYDIEFVVSPRRDDGFASDSEWSITFTAYVAGTKKEAIGGLPVPSDVFASRRGLFDETSIEEFERDFMGK